MQFFRMNKTFHGSKQGPAVNNRISAKSVRVISEKGENAWSSRSSESFERLLLTRV